MADAVESKEQANTEDTVKIEKKTPTASTKKVTKKRLDPNTLVPVMCNISGNLTYKSENSKRRYDWAVYGQVMDMELIELQNMLGSHPSYFKNNWIKIDDQEIVDYLRIGHYYKDAIDENDVESFFEMDTDEMNRFLDHIKPFERVLVVDRAKEKIKDKSFDSSHKIRFIEQKYNITLQG